MNTSLDVGGGSNGASRPSCLGSSSLLTIAHNNAVCQPLYLRKITTQSFYKQVYTWGTTPNNAFGCEYASTPASKQLEAYRSKHIFYRHYQHQESPNTKRTKVTQGYLQFQEQHGQVGIRFTVFFFFAVHAIPDKLAQRLLLSGLSVGQPPFSLLLFLRHWVSLSLFSWLIHVACINPFATCVYIQPIP